MLSTNYIYTYTLDAHVIIQTYLSYPLARCNINLVIATKTARVIDKSSCRVWLCIPVCFAYSHEGSGHSCVTFRTCSLVLPAPHCAAVHFVRIFSFFQIDLSCHGDINEDPHAYMYIHTHTT